MFCNCIEVGYLFFKDVGFFVYNRFLFLYNFIIKDWLDYNILVYIILIFEGGVGYFYIGVKFNLYIDNKISLNFKSFIYDIFYLFIFIVI